MMLEKDWIDKNSGFSVRKYISDDSRSPLVKLVFICQQKSTPYLEGPRLLDISSGDHI